MNEQYDPIASILDICLDSTDNEKTRKYKFQQVSAIVKEIKKQSSDSAYIKGRNEGLTECMSASEEGDKSILDIMKEYRQKGREDVRIELENCPQCVGLRDKFREEIIRKIEKEKIEVFEVDDEAFNEGIDKAISLLKDPTNQ